MSKFVIRGISASNIVRIESAEESGRYSPDKALELLKRVHDVVLAAIGTRAPSIRGDTDDNVYKHCDWIWMRREYEPKGKFREFLVTKQTSKYADVFLDYFYAVEIAQSEMRELLGGVFVECRTMG